MAPLPQPQKPVQPDDWIVGKDDLILVTGASGFIGFRVVENLLSRGFLNLRCFVRPSSNCSRLEALRESFPASRIQIVVGNLLSDHDCETISTGVTVIYHLAAGTGTDSFPDAFMNSVVTTRNLLRSTLDHSCLKRFVNVSSFAVYTNCNKPQPVLDESCPIETPAHRRGDAYCYAKIKQDEMVQEYGKSSGIPYVTVRPGVVYGPGKNAMFGRIGLGTFGLFLHLGGSNDVPLTYIDNCADAIVLAGLKKGVEGNVFNIVDDELPSSRELLRFYKKNVKSFRSVYLPRPLSFLFFWAWEKYSHWSQGQLPPAFNRSSWHAYWKGSCYTNQKLKNLLGWTQRVPTAEGLRRYSQACRPVKSNA